MVSHRDKKTLPSGHLPRANQAGPVSVTAPKHPAPEVEPGSQRVRRAGGPPALLSSDRFIERELIGRGGMGSVIRAYDKDLERDVAIKVLNPDSTTEANVARLTEEARITGELEHPHIVPVHEFGSDEQGARFLCMRLVKGETLEDTLNWAGPSRLEPDFLADLLQIFLKVCDAISFAHSRGVLHRDLKPSNVMVGDFGQVYVLDWGVARPMPRVVEEEGVGLSFSDPFGVLVGTPRYMAPEQILGQHQKLDERTDVFALGATLYQILTGEPPHPPDALSAIARGARVNVVPPEHLVTEGIVPGELSRIALKAMSHDPEDRYASVDALQHEIELFQRGAWHLPRAWFSAGSIIVGEGEPGDSAYIIVEGRCSAFGNDDGAEVLLREMGPGDVFGETAAFCRKPRSASVRALTDVVVMVVTQEVLGKALGMNRWMGTLVTALARRFRELDDRLRQLEPRKRRRSFRPPC
jgi:serine/threonine-protein kinase